MYFYTRIYFIKIPNSFYIKVTSIFTLVLKYFYSMFNSFLSFLFIFFVTSLFSQIVNTGMTTNYDSLETGKISIGGYVDTYYGFDFSQPANSERAYCVSSSRHNEININIAYIDVKYANHKIRGRIVPGFGTYMNTNYSAESGSLKNLIEANGGVCLSRKKNIWVDAGIIGSPYTNETIISKDHLIYTRSFGVEYSPYYLSGVKLSYPINKKLNSYVYVVNGWQEIFDVNKSMALGTQIEYRPNNKILINWDTYTGDEKSVSSPKFRNRYFTDLYVIYDNGKKFSFTTCAYVGIQSLKDSLGVKSDAVWWHANFTGSYKLKKDVSISSRIEYFSDPNSVQIHPITSAVGFSSYSGGVCLNVKVASHAMFRLEDRVYYSNQKVYLDRTNQESNSNNLLIGSLTVWF